MNNRNAILAFSALANSTRLQIIRHLSEAPSGGVPAGEIAEVAGATPSRTSFHLSALTEAGILRARKEARQIFYAVDYDRLGELMAFLLLDCCKEKAGEVLACCAAALKDGNG